MPNLADEDACQVEPIDLQRDPVPALLEDRAHRIVAQRQPIDDAEEQPDGRSNPVDRHLLLPVPVLRVGDTPVVDLQDLQLGQAQLLVACAEYLVRQIEPVPWLVAEEPDERDPRVVEHVHRRDERRIENGLDDADDDDDQHEPPVGGEPPHHGRWRLEVALDQPVVPGSGVDHRELIAKFGQHLNQSLSARGKEHDA